MPRPAAIALPILAAVAAATTWWLFDGSGDGPPDCPGESPYCSRDAYVELAAARCTDTTGDRDATFITRSTTVTAYCACMAGRMFDSFDAAALWRLDQPGAGGPERVLLGRQADTWAAGCMEG